MHCQIEHLFMHVFLPFFAFKNFIESAVTKGLRRCHDAPCIVSDGRPAFPFLCVWSYSEEKLRLFVFFFCNDKA